MEDNLLLSGDLPSLMKGILFLGHAGCIMLMSNCPGIKYFLCAHTIWLGMLSR